MIINVVFHRKTNTVFKCIAVMYGSLSPPQNKNKVTFLTFFLTIASLFSQFILTVSFIIQTSHNFREKRQNCEM